MATSNTKPLPPHNSEAEKATLGALILNPKVVYSVAPILEARDFYQEKNKKVYEAIMALHNQGLSCDPVTLDDRLARFSSNGVAWIDYIGELVQYTPDEDAAEEYARIVAEKATRRRMIGAASKVDNLARSEDGDIEQQLSEAETVVFNTRDGRGESEQTKPESYVLSYLKQFDELRQSAREISGLSTGFADADRLLNGLRAPHHYVLGARPGMGKSSLALRIADHCVKDGKNVALFSLEMSSKQIMDRRISAETNIPSQKIQKPWLLSDREAALVNEAAGKIAQRNLFIETQSGLTPAAIRSRTMRMHAEHGLDLVIVDHLHLVRPDIPRNRKDLEIDDNVRSLTGIYKTLGVPGLTVAQLNRGVEQRSDKRPLLSDLRESGAIEEEAFVAMLLYRDDYYNDGTSKTPNQAELNIAKNREGPTGTVRLFWDKERVCFKNLAHKEIAL